MTQKKINKSGVTSCIVMSFRKVNLLVNIVLNLGYVYLITNYQINDV